MTAPAQPTTYQAPPQTSQPDRHVIAGIVAVLASGATAAIMGGMLVRLLSALRISPAAARGALAVTLRVTRKQTRTGGPAEKVTAAGQDAYRAAYILAAARRIDAATAGKTGQEYSEALASALKAEARFAAQQQQAQGNRLAAARAVDAAAARVGKPTPSGKLLGWKARMDDRTSAECAAANGKNFAADRPPLIGWPGAVHPHCRCRPVKAFAGAGMVDDFATTTRKAA